MAARITISRDQHGQVQVYLNEAGRDALVRALLTLSRENDHVHLAPEGFGAEVPTREVAYQEADEVMAWGKVSLRPDGWDARHFPHVLWDWLPATQRLRAEDMPVLKRLEAWFTKIAPEMAEVCVGLVSGDDRFLDANLLRGPAALAGAVLLPGALSMRGDEHDLETILDEAPPETQQDRSAALSLAARIAPRSPDLARFLRAWAAT